MVKRNAPSPFLLGLPIVLLFGCTSSPIGDPCVPEVGPAGGFGASEIYLETNSTQCRTSVCMVYHLAGTPDVICNADGNPAGCVTRAQQDSQVFCSCRCSVADGGDANLPLCECTEGFRCDEAAVTAGESGVRGGYCVPCIEPGNPQMLDVTVFEACRTD